MTDLPPDGAVRGFDTGPGNALSDLWCARNRGAPFDAQGAWAATGDVIPALLDALLADPFFTAQPPKSTHRDQFSLQWLEERMRDAGVEAETEDVQATLVALTARSIADAIRRHAADAVEVLVCGGGARNGLLRRSLATRLPRTRVSSTDELGVPVDQVEAAAFAWLAHCFVERLPGNLPEVTGAAGLRVLGALYPAQ